MDFAPSCEARPERMVPMPLAERSQQTESSSLVPAHAVAELELALEHGLRTPVAALRASMEGLSSELRGVQPRPAAIPGALEEVDLLSRNVERLLEWAGPTEISPLRSSLEEVLRASSSSFRSFRHPRLLLIRPTTDVALFVDAPLLSRLLQRLIENALEASRQEDALLIARTHDDRISFSVVNHSEERFDPEWALGAFHSTKPNRLGLGLAIVARHAEALGATFRLDVTPERIVRASLELECLVRDDAEQASADEALEKRAA